MWTGVFKATRQRLIVEGILFLIFLSSCRTMPEGDAAAKRETADGVPIVAVLQYVVSVSWTFSEFTNLSHFMV